MDTALIGVPLYTMADYKGMGDAPSALRKAGLAKAGGSTRDLGDLTLPALNKDVTERKTKNLEYFRNCTSLVYGATRLIKAERVLVIGGECSETVGVMAGLAEAFKGRPGMLWMDAHGDFNTPEISPTGYVGGMCLAMACGRCPGLGLELGTKGPPLSEDHVVHVGSRALDPAESSALDSSPVKLITSLQIEKRGTAAVAKDAAGYLDTRSDWIACHLDLDVVDPKFIGSVNYPAPGGLSPDEAAAFIKAIAKTGKMKALEIAAYNVSKDRGGTSAVTIVKLLRNAFS